MPGGANLMQHNLRTTNDLIGLLPCLCLLFFVTTGSVNAGSIKTWNAPQLLQIGMVADSGDHTRKLQLPSDVAVLDNRVYVVDGSNHRIMVYDTAGRFLFDFGSKGSGPGQFYYPVGIDAADNDRIYIADSGNHRIQIFDRNGKYLSGFAVKSANKKGRPIDILRHSDNGRLFISSSDHRLLIYSDDGRLLDTWGHNGTSRGEFRYPATLSELNDGRIAVVDVLNSRVQVFNIDGSLSVVVGQWGVLPGQLFRPKGIAIDSRGNFYISDSYMGVVQKYKDDGSFSAVLGNRDAPRKLLTPTGMSIDHDRLYVVEMKNNRVSVYQLAD